MIKESQAYKMVAEHYGDRVALRSQVPLINHINEGITVLQSLGASTAAQEAFCLHPLLQDDQELTANCIYITNTVDTYVVMLAMEYRSVANEFLRKKVTEDDMHDSLEYCSQRIRLSPLKEVNDMLVADKVQNRKDFLTYHSETHPNRRELNVYFKMWMHRLGISEEQYQDLCKLIDDRKEAK